MATQRGRISKRKPQYKREKKDENFHYAIQKKSVHYSFVSASTVHWMSKLARHSLSVEVLASRLQFPDC